MQSQFIEKVININVNYYNFNILFLKILLILMTVTNFHLCNLLENFIIYNLALESTRCDFWFVCNRQKYAQNKKLVVMWKMLYSPDWQRVLCMRCGKIMRFPIITCLPVVVFRCPREQDLSHSNLRARALSSLWFWCHDAMRMMRVRCARRFGSHCMVISFCAARSPAATKRSQLFGGGQTDI